MPSESRARIQAPLDQAPGRRVHYLDGGNSVGPLAKNVGRDDLIAEISSSFISSHI